MSWMITASGREYHFTGAMAATDAGRPVGLQDIAHQLALINRFHGATHRPYSVAEHSLLVAEIGRRAGAAPIAQLAALMHDAHETYTNDLASPAKRAVNLEGMTFHGSRAAWSSFEREHANAVMRAFGLVTAYQAHRADIQRWDLIAMATERRDLTAWNAERHAPWAVLRDGQADAIEPADWIDLNHYEHADQPWQYWRDAFVVAFAALKTACEQGRPGEE